MKFKYLIPLLIGLLLGFMLGGWWGFKIIFPWIGAWITIGNLIAVKRKGKAKDLGRRLSILMISPVFLIFLGTMQRENLQIEEAVFYTLFFISSGIFTRVLTLCHSKNNRTVHLGAWFLRMGLLDGSNFGVVAYQRKLSCSGKIYSYSLFGICCFDINSAYVCSIGI